jgi:predicted DNA-binding mobile mystery protein A
MAYKNQKLILGQVNAKVKRINQLGNIPPPGQGWINGIRIALNMTMEQLADKLNMTTQSISEAEQREREGTITLKSLSQIANALNMKLFYAIIPENGDLDEKIEKAAFEKATQIVKRTSQTMALEDQASSETIIQQMIKDKKEQLIAEMPKLIWE